MQVTGKEIKPSDMIKTPNNGMLSVKAVIVGDTMTEVQFPLNVIMLVDNDAEVDIHRPTNLPSQK